MMKKLKTTKGITLIALIITVIVLLILAGVSINMVIGENGLINKAQSAVNTYQNSATEEQVFLNEIENYITGGLANIDNMGEEGIIDTVPQKTELAFGAVGTYGDYVEYNVDLNDDGDITNDWRIFYAEDNRVYIIAADYLLNSKVPTNIGMAKSGTYKLYWPSAPSYTTINDNTKELFYYRCSASTENNNTKCISHLLDTNKWTSFAAGYSGAVAIGSPTLEIWIESWNDKYSSDKLYTSSNTTGNYVATISGGTTTSVNLKDKTGYSNTLYFPYTLATSDSCLGYWLASPSANRNNSALRVDYNGNVNYDGFDYCVRPLVCLPVGVQANKEGNIWKLV